MIPAIRPDGSLYPVEKLAAHSEPLLHLAVSVFVFDRDELLIQQRAAQKYHCGGQWANTCCSHPQWGESLVACAARRLDEELGFTLPLQEFGKIEYLVDVGGGLFEHERVSLFIGHALRETLEIDPDPAEVMSNRWISRNSLVEEMQESPEHFAPWFRIYVEQYAEMIFGQ